MTAPTGRQADALVSARLAADLCGVSLDRVMALLSSKAIRLVRIQGRQVVSLQEVERAIEEGNRDPSN